MAKRIRRSLLYIPATSEKFIEKAPDTNADAIVYELDDGIGSRKESKLQGRENLSLVPDLDHGEKEVCVRINSLDSDYWFDDLSAALDIGVDTVILPKVSYPWHIKTALETTKQIVSDVPEFIFTIERSPGFAAIEQIIRTSGEYDNITGIYPGFEAAEIVGADANSQLIRDHFNLEAMKYAPLGNLDLFGTAHLEIEDEEVIRESLEREKELGYKGRIAIHPKQVGIINDVFTPSKVEYNRANEIVEEWEENNGEPFRTNDGEFIDRPLVNIYKEEINRYNLIHDIDEELEITHSNSAE